MFLYISTFNAGARFYVLQATISFNFTSIVSCVCVGFTAREKTGAILREFDDHFNFRVYVFSLEGKL